MPAIYHITHINNLEQIIQAGGLHCDRDAQMHKTVNIGHQHIKNRRLMRTVEPEPGGVVGDYVPFYFAPRSPMLYAIHRDNVEGYEGGQKPVIYLRSSTDAVSKAQLPFVFTEGHAEMAYTDFYNDLKDLDKVDWKLLDARYWNDTDEDGDRKRRRQAEFLVHEFFPWELVLYIGVCDGSGAEKVATMIDGQEHKPELGINPGWYY